MPDASDILKDPTEHLRQLLNRLDENGLQVDRDVYLLHRHILAGGALPRQWTEEKTAVGALTKEVRSMLGWDDMPEMFAAVRAVTGEG